MSGEAGKGDRDTRTSSFKQRRENFENIKGLNDFKPYWMRKTVKKDNSSSIKNEVK